MSFHGTSRRVVGVITCVVAFTQCKSDRPPAAGSPEEALAPPVLPALLSHFDVPLQYDFAPVMYIVERTVPRTFGSLDSLHVVGTDSGKHYAYTATRGPFTAVADGAVVRMRATLSYTARGYYKTPIGPTLSAGCGGGDERPRIAVELVAPLTITEDWHLKSKASLGRLAPASDAPRDRCTVSIIRYDVTERVIDAARRGLTGQLPKIDQQVAKVDLTKLATGWWKLLNRPIRLTDSVWLVLQPRQLRLGAVAGQGHVLTVGVGLDAMPQVVTGLSRRASAPPLPPLAHGGVSEGYRIMLDGLIDYQTASRGITATMGNKTFTKGGQTVRIRDVDLMPSTRGRLAITVHFAGDIDGRLRLLGTPQYDPKLGVIRAPDLDYDLETSNDLVNAYAWLRSDALRSQFREAVHVSVQPALDRGKELLIKGLNRKLGDAVTLSATVDSVSVRGIFITRAGLLVRAEAIGNASMAVRQTKPKS